METLNKVADVPHGMHLRETDVLPCRRRRGQTTPPRSPRSTPTRNHFGTHRAGRFPRRRHPADIAAAPPDEPAQKVIPCAAYKGT